MPSSQVPRCHDLLEGSEPLLTKPDPKYGAIGDRRRPVSFAEVSRIPWDGVEKGRALSRWLVDGPSVSRSSSARATYCGSDDGDNNVPPSTPRTTPSPPRQEQGEYITTVTDIPLSLLFPTLTTVTSTPGAQVLSGVAPINGPVAPSAVTSAPQEQQVAAVSSSPPLTTTQQQLRRFLDKQRFETHFRDFWAVQPTDAIRCEVERRRRSSSPGEGEAKWLQPLLQLLDDRTEASWAEAAERERAAEAARFREEWLSKTEKELKAAQRFWAGEKFRPGVVGKEWERAAVTADRLQQLLEERHQARKGY
ncbi:MAG: hypothetical protein LQ346_003305 [Caloplaca aetnensis]|nr:MAG: hypothetical protein LQ346_003305 [Caloplaca aetnensis]